MRCLVIEDEADTARYIGNGLAEAGHTATLCDNGIEGLDLATHEDWDVVILDRMLPGGIDGLAIVDSLRKTGNKTPILILSALGEVDERIRGLRAGGDDYLAKPFAFGELSARLDALARRSQGVGVRTELAVGDLRMDLLARKVTRAGKTILLQPREFKLLEYLMRHGEQVVTRTMLLESVWEYHFDPQTNIIDMHISKLRQKIDAGFDRRLLHTVRGVGYRLSAND